MLSQQKNQRRTLRCRKASGWFNTRAYAKWTQPHERRHSCGHPGQLLHTTEIDKKIGRNFRLFQYIIMRQAHILDRLQWQTQRTIIKCINILQKKTMRKIRSICLGCRILDVLLIVRYPKVTHARAYTLTHTHTQIHTATHCLSLSLSLSCRHSFGCRKFFSLLTLLILI